MHLALLVPVLLLSLTFAISILAYSVSKIAGREISLRRIKRWLSTGQVGAEEASGMLKIMD